MTNKKENINNLQEVEVLGKIGYPEDSTIYFLRFLQEEIGEKKFETFCNKILQKVAPEGTFKKGYTVKNLVYDIFNSQSYNIKRNVKNYLDLLSHLGYIISKKYLKFSTSKYLEYVIEKDGEERNYFFLDPETQIYIGYIKTTKLEYLFNNINFPKRTYVVNTTNLDKDLINTGLGKMMYLTILEDIDVLLSDTYLYESALNIWLNVLPKYTKLVGAIPNDSDEQSIKILTPQTQLGKYIVDDFVRYFATQKPEKVKIKEKQISESDLSQLSEIAMDLDIYRNLPNVGTGSQNSQSEKFVEEIVDKLKELLFIFKANKKVDTSLKSQLNKNLDNLDVIYNKIKSKSF